MTPIYQQPQVCASVHIGNRRVPELRSNFPSTNFPQRSAGVRIAWLCAASLAILLLGVACSGGNGKDRAAPSLSLVFLRDPDVAQMEKSELLAKLRKAKSDLGKNETENRRFLDQFESAVTEWDDDPTKSGELQKRAASLHVLAVRLISEGPQDFETQLIAASNLLGISYTMENLEMDFKPVREEAIEATKSLVQKFPKEDRAHGQLGMVLLTSNESNVQAARSQFEICLKLNPANKKCQDRLSKMAGM